jgi:hypothetical protein
METLSANLRQRSEELDGMMKSFTRIIAETLRTAEERATAVSRMLTENTSGATKTLIDNFETMNRTASSESRKTAEAVREANRSLIDEMGHAISEATKRFAEATREMRGATQELQRDLNVAREEMRRGVLELPQETRDSAEAMRRVVGDQIKALSELSEIVTRHGKTLDLSSPSLGEPRALPRSENLAPAVGAENNWSDRPETSSYARSSVRGSNGGSNGFADARSPSAKQPPRAVPRPPSGVRNGGEGSEGWVSDLLRRASTDDESAAAKAPSTPANQRPTEPTNGGGAPTPPAAVSDSFSSADIARAIDHEAAVELWDRHSRGERNLFTRRLYTLQGQQTFDDIRKRYQRDQEFRSAVDRYVADFEALLNEITKNNKDRAASGAYLTSDTGKVYTMLAHASGRFD